MNILEEIQNCPVEWKELEDKNVAKLSRGKVMSKQFLEENRLFVNCSGLKKS